MDVFILYLFSDFTPLVPQNRRDVLAIYKTMELCETSAQIMRKSPQVTDPHMRFECKKAEVIG